MVDNGPSSSSRRTSYAPASQKNSMFDIDGSILIDMEMVENYIVVPPDGGWGWLIVLCAFFCNMITDGITYCFGLFLTDIAATLQCTVTMASIATSVLTAIYYLLGPVFCAMTNRLGFRTVTIMGALMASGSFLAASFCDNLYLLIITCGVCGGAAFSMIYIASVIIVGFYFERWRAMATAIAVTGSAVGVVIFPPLLGLLSDYTWQSKFRMIAGLLGFLVLLGLTYKPLYPIRVMTSQEKHMQFDKISVISEEETGHLGNTFNKFNRYHNQMFPTSAALHGSNSVIIGPHSMQNSKISLRSKMSTKSGRSFGFSRRRYSPVTSLNSVRIYVNEDSQSTGNCCMCCYGECCRNRDIKRHPKITYTRPLYRDDIFFAGSIMTLDNYTSKSRVMAGPSIDYHMSVTRVSTPHEIEEQERPCVCCPESIVRILATMLDVNLLKHGSFFLLMLSGFFTVLGLYIPYLYIIEKNIVNGVNPKVAKYLLSTIGLTNALGRIACGFISLNPKIRAMTVTIVFLFIAGLFVIGMGLYDELYFQFACCTLFGLSVAANSALRSIIIVDLWGLEKLTNAFGINVLFQGFACILGLPLAGILKDITRGYMAPFVFSGTAILISAFILIPIEKMSAKEKVKDLLKEEMARRKQKTKIDNANKTQRLEKGKRRPWGYRNKKVKIVMSK